MKHITMIGLLLACGHQPHHVRVVDRTGQLAVEYGLSDGLKNGPISFFRNDGSLRGTGVYENDRKQGDWITLSERGDTLDQLHYFKGLKNGWQSYRAASKQLVRLERFDKGIPDGPLYMFFEDGGLREETWFKQGVTTGRHLRWWRTDTTDACALMGHYEEGGLVGTWRFFHGNGQLCSEDRYMSGTPHGTWRKWDRQGRVIKEQVWEHGTLVRERGFAVR